MCVCCYCCGVGSYFVVVGRLLLVFILFHTVFPPIFNLMLLFSLQKEMSSTLCQ